MPQGPRTPSVRPGKLSPHEAARRSWCCRICQFGNAGRKFSARPTSLQVRVSSQPGAEWLTAPRRGRHAAANLGTPPVLHLRAGDERFPCNRRATHPATRPARPCLVALSAMAASIPCTDRRPCERFGSTTHRAPMSAVPHADVSHSRAVLARARKRRSTGAARRRGPDAPRSLGWRKRVRHPRAAARLRRPCALRPQVGRDLLSRLRAGRSLPPKLDLRARCRSREYLSRGAPQAADLLRRTRARRERRVPVPVRWSPPRFLPPRPLARTSCARVRGHPAQARCRRDRRASLQLDGPVRRRE